MVDFASFLICPHVHYPMRSSWCLQLISWPQIQAVTSPLARPTTKLSDKEITTISEVVAYEWGAHDLGQS